MYVQPQGFQGASFLLFGPFRPGAVILSLRVAAADAPDGILVFCGLFAARPSAATFSDAQGRSLFGGNLVSGGFPALPMVFDSGGNSYDVPLAYRCTTGDTWLAVELTPTGMDSPSGFVGLIVSDP